MTSPELLSIGTVAARSGVPITTLRYYERRGLIEPPDRQGGQRRYRPEVLVRLMVIRFCRIAGLDLDSIARIVNDVSEGQETTEAIAATHLSAIDQQMEQLTMAKAMMEAALVCSCASVEHCGCGAMAPVIETYGGRLDALGF